MADKNKSLVEVFSLDEDITKKDADKVKDPQSLHQFLNNVVDTVNYVMPSVNRKAGQILAKHPEELQKLQPGFQGVDQFIKRCRKHFQ